MTWTEVTALLTVGLAMWLLAGIDYARRLNRVLARREERVLRGLRHLVERNRLWEEVLSEAEQRELRDTALAFDRMIGQLESEIGIEDKLLTARDVGMLLDGQVAVLKAHPQDFPAEALERAESMRRALAGVERALQHVLPAAADSQFMCDRFPLSVMAAISGLRRPAI